MTSEKVEIQNKTATAKRQTTISINAGTGGIPSGNGEEEIKT